MKNNIKIKNSALLTSLEETASDNITVRDINLYACSPYFRKVFQKKHANELHSKIMLNLTHEIIPEPDAKLLWDKIVKHMHDLNDALQRNVGITVAAMDYLSNINTTIVKPVIIDEDMSSKLVSSSITDKLTMLHTKEFFNDALNREVEVFYRDQSPLCLIMMDIDDFKEINDHFGHLKGDEVLVTVGKIIKTYIRKVDISARYGGEEFVVIMPHCVIDDAKKIAERIRLEIEQNRFFDDVKITVSAGVSYMSKATNSKERLIEYADIALYESKANGKNQVSVYYGYSHPS